MENKDKPAFPVLELKEIDNKYLLDLNAEGLSKREYFAVMAMQGFIASFAGHPSNPTSGLVASKAVEYADALLAELSKPQP